MGLLIAWLFTGWVLVVVLGIASLAHLAFPRVVTLEDGQQLWQVWAMAGTVWLISPLLLLVIFLPMRWLLR